MKLSLIIRKLLMSAVVCSTTVASGAIELSSSSSNNSLYVGPGNVYTGASMTAYDDEGNFLRGYTYTGKWTGTAVSDFDRVVTMGGGTTVYVASDPMASNGERTTSAAITVNVAATTEDAVATIASGNGGWYCTASGLLGGSNSFTAYAPTTEGIEITGAVTGSGYLRLQGNGTISTTFKFTGTDTSDWFTGVVSMANVRGTKTYLDIADDRWQGAVIDFGLYESTGLVPSGGTNKETFTYPKGTPTEVGLTLSGNGAVAALSGGASGGVINGNKHTLSLKGTQGVYTYEGALSSDLSLTMAGSYTQKITGKKEIGNITVISGILNFTGNVLDANEDSAVTVSGGSLLVGTLEEDGTLSSSEKAQLYGTDVTVSGEGKLSVSDALTASGKLTVSGGELFGMVGAINAAELEVSGGTIYAGVDKNRNNTSTGSSAGIQVTGNATVTSGAIYAGVDMSVTNKLDMSGGEVQVNNLKARTLEQTGGSLTVSGNAQVDNVTIDGATSTVVTGALTGETLTLGADSEISTGTGTELDSVTLGSGSVWNTSGATIFDELTLAQIGSTETAARIHTQDGTSWLGLTHITLDYAANADKDSYAVTLSSATSTDLALEHVLTITGAEVIETMVNDTLLYNTITLAQLENITLPGGVLQADGETLVYVLANGKVYEGELFTGTVNDESMLQVRISGEADNSIIVESGTNLRITHNQEGLFDIYQNATYENGAWSGNPFLEAQSALPNRIYLNDGSALYLNDEYQNNNAIGGEGQVIEILPGKSEIHTENNIPVWNMGGVLTGVGHVNLVAHTDDVTVYRYTNEAVNIHDAWFSGTLGLANAHGGDVQMDIANIENDTRWKDTLFDLGPHAAECITESGTVNAAENTILLLEGDATIKGLTNSNTEDASSTRVVTNITQGDASYTLTLGTDTAATPYIFYGKLGEGTFYSTDSGTGTPTLQTSVTGSLNLHKIGANTQLFMSDVTLNDVQIDKGTLGFGGLLNANSVTVNAGGTLVTREVGDVDRINLQGGSGWYISDDMMSSATTIAFSGSGSVSMGTYDGNTDAVFYLPVKLNLKDSTGIGYSADQALFTKRYGDTMTVNTDNALNFTYTDTKAGDVIYVTNNVMNSREQSLLQDVEGRFVDIVMDAAGNPVDSKRYYAQMHFDNATGQLTATRTDIQVFTWMGEENGTTPGDLCINPDSNLVYGHVWTTQTNENGYTVNTGWHEQDMGAGQGVYVDGAYVDFLHMGIHGESVPFVDVDIVGAVAPGHIYVNTENIYRGSAKEGTPISYGFAFTSNDGTGLIKDFEGTPTQLVKEGKGMLVIDVDNQTTGGIALRHGSIYSAVPTALGKGEIHMHDGTTVYVNYLHSDDPLDDHRHPVVSNNFTLTEGASVTVGYAPFVYAYEDVNADGVQSVTRHWRYMLLDGTFSGDEDSVLHLSAYNSCWNKTDKTDPYLELYTSGFILKNSDNAQGGYFHGTVKLENQVNTSKITGGAVGDDRLNSRWTGEVRLQLSDDYLRNALLDASREGVWTTPAIKNNADGSYYDGTTEFRQTYRHLIMMEGDTTLRGLSATLLGTTPESFVNSDTSNTYYSTTNRNNLIKYIRNSGNSDLLNYSVTNEVDLVHVATAGDFVLNLNNDGQQYWYSGKMGYATQYVGTEQVGKTYYDPLDETTGETFGETLSLVMTSENGATGAQYIHSAQLVNLTLRQGTLGFNQLDVSGDVYMNTDTTLALSVQTNTSSNVLGSEVDTSWKTVDEDGLVIYGGQALTVNVLSQNDEPATIEGNVTLSANSSLNFVGNNVDADNGVENVFLDVNGTLTMVNNESLNLSIQGVNFPFTGFVGDGDGKLRQTWYLAEADEIVMSGDPLTFTKRIIQLESGYVGLIGVEDEYKHDDGSTNDYIMVTVLGDPRRTWTGNTGNMTIDNILDDADVEMENVGGSSNEFTNNGENNAYKWIAGSFGDDGSSVKTSNKWKEELTFFNGCLTLFGNLYNAQSTDDTTVVDTQTALQSGWVTGDTAPKHQVDDEDVAYQYVQIVGEVAPMMLTVNGDYYDATGKLNPLVDATNYVFAGDGFIRDVTSYELGDFYGYNNLENLDLIDWRTSLSKEGRGILVMTNTNTYSGGTQLKGGAIVMQNASALGKGTVTISGAAVLQADFADTNNEYTSTVKNEVRAFNRDATGDGYGITNGGDNYVATLVNDSDKRMILTSLTGQSDAAVLLNGHATTTAQRKDHGYTLVDTYASGSLGSLVGDKYTIGVYEILNASNYYGTLRMQGQVAETMALAETTPTCVGVQLNVDKGVDWSHLGIDLSLNNSASTALYLEAGAITLPVLDGSQDGGSGVSHVVTTTGGTNNLTINATKTASYFGNMGFGFYQEEDGTLEYNTGTVNIVKDGAGSQTVGNAELGSLHLNAGKFYVSGILQVDSVSNTDATSKIRVGAVDGTADAAPHTIVVDNGILSLGGSGDVLSGVTTGAAAEDGRQVHVLLSDGAVLTAHANWYTAKNIDIHRSPADAERSSVTINTHHFEVDPWDYNRLGTENASTAAHVIRLNRGEITGDNAIINVTNDALDTKGVQSDVASSQQGYVAIKDLNQVTNSTFKVTDMATLQLTEGATSLAVGTNEVEVRGHEATLQLINNKQTTAKALRLGHDADTWQGSDNGGQVYIGGAAVTDNTGHTASATHDVLVRLRAYSQEGDTQDGVVDNVALSSNSSQSRVYMDATNGEAQASMANTMAAIMQNASLEMDDVLVMRDSILHGGEEPVVSTEIIKRIDVDPNASTYSARVVTTPQSSSAAGTTIQISTSLDTTYSLGTGSVYHGLVNQVNNIDVSGDGVTLEIEHSFLDNAYKSRANVVALQISGDAGRFYFEEDEYLDNVNLITSEGYSVTLVDSHYVAETLGMQDGSISEYNLYLLVVPEPTTTTLSLLALTALLARRRRK